jgi:hypothetical protein
MAGIELARLAVAGDFESLRLPLQPPGGMLEESSANAHGTVVRMNRSNDRR